MGVTVTVQIVSASNLGGTFPFVVVCFDNDLQNEVYKSAAANGGSLAVWNETFTLDLTDLMKKITEQGKQEPQYLTFFMFDTGVESIPSLGSAGVLLSTVRDNGMAKGDYPVVNGTGTLALVVQQETNDSKWYQTNTAKIVGGTLGVGALAAGVAAMATNYNKKKKNKSTNNDPNSSSSTSDKKKKGKFSAPGMSASRNNQVVEDDEEDDDDDDDDDDADDDDYHNQHQPLRNNSNNNGQNNTNTNTGARKWYDPDTDGEDEHDDHGVDDDHDDPDNRQSRIQQQQQQQSSQQYPPYEPSSQQAHYEPGGRTAQNSGDVHGSNQSPYHDPPATSRNVPPTGVQPGPSDSSNNPEFGHHLHAREELGEYGGTSYVVDDGQASPNYDD